MNTKFNHMNPNISLRKVRGMTLLDVLLAIVIFAVGMLALAALQGNLTRSSTDANVRTVATNVAEELIEGLRTISDIGLPPDATCETDLAAIAEQHIYQCITDSTTTVSRGDVGVPVNFNVTASIDDYWLTEDFVSVTDNPDDLPAGWSTTNSNFKIIELTVNWSGEAVGFQDAPVGDVLLGSGEFIVSAIIPSIPNIGSAKIASEDDELAGAPPVAYTPGERPDIVAIDLQGDRFKESTTPRPDVKRAGEVLETWFDVITYNQVNAGAQFLRREEFLVVSCECTLQGADDANKALMPTVWNGSEYSEERLVAKPYGIARNGQSLYCDTCCRDHHDDGSSGPDDVYDPARFTGKDYWSEARLPALGGDHAHYSNTNQGLELADVDDSYVEACRMVRKDGFMRVAQDLRQEGFFGFPEGYLNTDSGALAYSGYVTTEVSAAFPIGNGNGENSGDPNQDRLTAPTAGTFPDSTTLPFLGVSNTQQMRSRAVYMDHLSAEAWELVSCLQDYDAEYLAGDRLGDTPGEKCADLGLCETPSTCTGLTHHTQALPFFDVETTWLNWWNVVPVLGPVTVSNEDVDDDNAHSRGLATLVNPLVTATSVDVNLNMYRGNIGLAVTDPITLAEEDDPNTTAIEHNGLYALNIAVNGGGAPQGATGYSWTASLDSSVNQVNFADASITPDVSSNTICARTTTMLSCVTPDAEAGSIDISGYSKKQGNSWTPLYICINQPPVEDQIQLSVTNAAGGEFNSAVISWPAATNVTLSNIEISIETSATGCN